MPGWIEPPALPLVVDVDGGPVRACGDLTPVVHIPLPAAEPRPEERVEDQEREGADQMGEQWMRCSLHDHGAKADK